MFVDSQHGGRPQRANLLNPNLNHIGVYTCPHGDQRFTVVDYSGKMELKAAAQNEIAVLLRKHHPKIGEAPQQSERCSSLPPHVVKPVDCAVFDELNSLR